MLGCLLSHTRRKAKSRTSTGILSLAFLLVPRFSGYIYIHIRIYYLSGHVLKFFNVYFFSRKQQQPQVERGDFSPCGTPTGLDSRDPYDLQLGKLNYKKK